MARTNYNDGRVIELLEQAMGGRSAKDYSEATGIDPAIISRIKCGNYRPGKKILSQIAQENPSAVSFDELMEAAGYSEKDISEANAKELATIIGTLVGSGTALAGAKVIAKAVAAASGMGAVGIAPMIAPAVVASVVMRTVGKGTNQVLNNLSMESDKRDKKEVEQLKASQKRFKVMAMGMIYQSLISRKIASNNIGDEIGAGTDLYLRESLLIDDLRGISRRVDLYFVHYEENILGGLPVSMENLAVILLSKFAFDEPKEDLQIDILTDNKDLYESLTQLACKTSIKANIMSLLIDIENTEIEDEEVIATYKDQKDDFICFMETK